MKRLIPAPPHVTPNFDPLVDFPEDIERLVMVAAAEGYTVTPRDAGVMWRQRANNLRASWFAVEGSNQEIVAGLLQHAEVLPDVSDASAPPSGYASWLDYAVDTMDTRTEEQEQMWAGIPVSRQAMREAARAELLALRRRAGDC